MLKTRRRIDVQIVIALLVVAACVAAVIIPKSPLFLMKVFNARKQLADTYQQIRNSEEALKTQKGQLPQLEAQVADYNAKINALNDEIKKLNLKPNPHMPSILILLEQNAKYFGLQLEIYYDKIRELAAAQSTSTPSPPAENNKDQDKKSQEGGQTGTKTETSTGSENKSEATNSQAANQTPKGTANTGKDPVTVAGLNNAPKLSEEEVAVRAHIDAVIGALPQPTNDLVTVTAIPVLITGKYEETREYLHFLDQVDYIEPAYIEMRSDGKEINSLVVLYVFALKGDAQ